MYHVCCSGLFPFRHIPLIHTLSSTIIPHTHCYTHTPIGSLSSFGSLPDQFGQLSVGGGRGRGRGFAYGAVRQPKTVGGLQQTAVSRQWEEEEEVEWTLFCFVLQYIFYQLSTFSSVAMYSDSHSLHRFTVYIFSVYSATACVILCHQLSIS